MRISDSGFQISIPALNTWFFIANKIRNSFVGGELNSCSSEEGADRLNERGGHAAPEPGDQGCRRKGTQKRDWQH